jgi:Mce-associated membrane protein
MPPRRTELPTDADSAPEAESMSDPTPGEPTSGTAMANPVAGGSTAASASAPGSTARPRAKRRPAGETRPRAAGTALAEPPAAAPSVKPAATEPEESDADTDLQSAAQATTVIDAPSGAETTNGIEAKPAEAEARAAANPAPGTGAAGTGAAGTGAAAYVEAGPEAGTETDRKRMRLLVGVAALAVLLVCASVVLAVGAVTARTSGPLANKAFLDTGQTAELVGQVTSAMTTVYSYNYSTLPANEAAAKGLVTGKFADEFARVFEPVKQLAPQEQAVLKSTVPAAGVILLQGDRARLLMMVDQTGTRGTAKEPTGATARLLVDAQNVDGRWKIAGVTPE